MNSLSTFAKAHDPVRLLLTITTCQRVVGRRLLAVAMLLGGLATTTQAAVIEVDSDGADGVVEIADDGLCSIREAIINANDDDATHTACAAGDGADTIALPAGAVFTLTDEAVNDSTHGKSGLPHITSEIILHGNGATIQRDDSLTCNLDGADDPGEFRLLLIENDGNLEAQDLTLAQGCADSETTSGAAPRRGGAIRHAGGSLTLIRTTVRDNLARIGGGLDNAGDASTLVEASTFSGNEAIAGGALNVWSGTLHLRNVTLSGNSAGNRGGGLQMISGVVNLEHVTFSGNTAENTGGGIWVGDMQNLRAKNVIFQDSGCFSLFPHFTWIAEGANLDSGTSCADEFGSNFSANTDAELDSLADNGGPTQTHALEAGSPARDSAIDCTDFDNNPIATDQRGIARPVPFGGVCDIGAFELAVPGIDLTKTITGGDPYAAVGDEVTYELVAENSGHVTLHDVTVTDLDATGGCSISSLAPGETISCQASYTIDEDDVAAGSFTNTTSVAAEAADGSTLEATASATAYWVQIFSDRFAAEESP